MPKHVCLDDISGYPPTDGRAAGSKAFTDVVETLANDSDFIVVDAPGHDSPLVRMAHSMADTIVTPLNDSFIDLDVLATVNHESFGITGISYYARMVQEARCERELLRHANIDWVVLRNRLSMLEFAQQADCRRKVGAALTAT